MSVLRIGLVGSGYMGKTYAECIKRYCRGGAIAGVALGSRAPKLATDYDTPLFPSLDAMLASHDVDAVLIATPHSAHLGQVRAAARAGKHVLVEKPMGLNTEECDQMIDACRQAGVTFSVIQTNRFRGSVARGKHLIDAGRIGPVRMIQLRTLFEWVPILGTNPGAIKPWTQDPREGGLILDQGAHNFDFLRWYAGAAPTRVFGRIQTYAPGQYPFPTAMAQVEFANGVLAQNWMSFELPKPGMGKDHQFRALVVGETGMLDVDPYGKLLGAFDGKEWELVWEQPAIDYINRPLAPERLEAFYTQVQDFIDAVRDGRPPAVTAEDGRAAIALIDAVRQSSATGQAVTL
jgi:predicted dehydrogenase